MVAGCQHLVRAKMHDKVVFSIVLINILKSLKLSVNSRQIWAVKRLNKEWQRQSRSL